MFVLLVLFVVHHEGPEGWPGADAGVKPRNTRKARKGAAVGRSCFRVHKKLETPQASLRRLQRGWVIERENLSDDFFDFLEEVISSIFA